jgi:large subunit ribosomal protein L15e
MKSSYKFISDAWSKPTATAKPYLQGWRAENVVTRIDRPTRLDRARELGYKAKQGFAVARIRIGKGGRKRPKPSRGRKPRKSGRFFTTKLSLQAISEQRVARKFPNLEVLNSYFVGEDGTSEFYEVILVDPDHPSIKDDRKIGWVMHNRGRVFRGQTRSGRDSRGLGHHAAWKEQRRLTVKKT